MTVPVPHLGREVFHRLADDDQAVQDFVKRDPAGVGVQTLVEERFSDGNCVDPVPDVGEP